MAREIFFVMGCVWMAMVFASCVLYRISDMRPRLKDPAGYFGLFTIMFMFVVVIVTLVFG